MPDASSRAVHFALRERGPINRNGTLLRHWKPVWQVIRAGLIVASSTDVSRLGRLMAGMAVREAAETGVVCETDYHDPDGSVDRVTWTPESAMGEIARYDPRLARKLTLRLTTQASAGREATP